MLDRGMAGMCEFWAVMSMVLQEEGRRTNRRDNLALHQLTHWRMQAVNVAMHGELEISLCFVPL